TEENCGDRAGGYVYREDSDKIGIDFSTRVIGRTAAGVIKHPKTDKVLAESSDLISKEQAKAIDESGVDKVKIRTATSCKTLRGICQKCYGIDLGRSNVVTLGQAVGTVAAQAIGEPGTQLTMRTFHIGGVAGSDITQGLPRVEEIFEARAPKGESIISEIDGKVVEYEDDGGKTVTVVIEESDGKKKKQKKYNVPSNSTVNIAKGDLVTKGMQLNEGHIDLKKLYATMGKEAVHRYIVSEIQNIYASQGEGINDKHIEIIIRQMFSRISIKDAGDTTLIPGEIVEMSEFNDSNSEVGEKGQHAEGEPMILGITKVALSTESFLSAASFQETARVLINASITGKKDHLRGLKENVIIGRLIPAGTGFRTAEDK
ncbi:MAG: DNA-directed RNA polymerase subunit beta', partial [Patescibacteria group bacterium]